MSPLLEDPAWVPRHPPIDGRVPAVVAKWGPRSQLRWFRRFSGQIKPMSGQQWGLFHCDSIEHTGQCCSSCDDDYEYEGYPNFDGAHCCCYGFRADDDD